MSGSTSGVTSEARTPHKQVWRYLIFLVAFFSAIAACFVGLDSFWLWSANGGFDNLVWRLRYHGDAGDRWGKGRWRDPQRCDSLIGTSERIPCPNLVLFPDSLPLDGS